MKSVVKVLFELNSIKIPNFSYHVQRYSVKCDTQKYSSSSSLQSKDMCWATFEKLGRMTSILA